MPGRVNDERLQYFSVDYVDIGVHTDDYKSEMIDIDNQVDPMVQLIWRYDLTKGPIRIHIDYSVPKEWRHCFKKGIEAWNRAFKLVGYPNGIQGVSPDDDDWPKDYDAGDARFSTITWDINTESIFSMGIAKVDPRSGEVIKSDIIMSQGWVLAWLSDLDHLDLHQTHKPAQGYRHERRIPRVNLDRERTSSLPPRKERTSADLSRTANLSAVHGGLQLLQTARAGVSKKDVSFMEQSKAVLVTAGVPERSWFQAVQDGLTDIVMHEVGHVIGLRHNFKGSLGVSFECTLDKACTAKHGLTASVMDYIPTNIPSTGTDNVHLFTPHIGDYDILAIRFGYTKVSESEEKNGVPITPLELKELLEEANDLQNCNDDDEYYNEDPLCRAYDFTSEPLKYYDDQLKLLKKLQRDLFNREVDPGEPFYLYGGIVSSLLRKAFGIQEDLYYWLGGVNTSRMHRSLNTSSTQVPVQPIPVKDQRQALQVVLEIMDPYKDGLLPPPEALSLMAEKEGDFVHRFHPHSVIRDQQKMLLEALLRSSTLIYVDEAKDIDGLSADILLTDMVAYIMGGPDGITLINGSSAQNVNLQDQFVGFLAQPRADADQLPADIELVLVSAMEKAKAAVDGAVHLLSKQNVSSSTMVSEHLQMMRKKLKGAIQATGIALPEVEAKSMAAARSLLWLSICSMLSFLAAGFF